mmetsp:Transcript_16938/g.59188  ORF Transcript_16938/g.59188 Transcript_16938/m.59188 type:complete len:394 (-) Transcript_16938:577-1758(-)
MAANGEATAAATPAAMDAHHRRMATEDAIGHAATGVHKVMVSVPLKLGRESPLLRTLGLGIEAHKQAIRDGNTYDVSANVDLAAALKTSTSGDWYFYSGGPLAPGSCPAWGVKWMVFQEPLEVSLEQLNYLTLQVSGVDATPLPKKEAAVFFEAVPARAIALGACENDEHLKNDPSCWAAFVPACGGAAQSPINLVSAGEAKAVGSNSFLRKTSWKPVSGLRVMNDGYSLAVQTTQMGYTTVIGESGFPKFYQVTGVTIKMPSEHTINGKQYAAELQVVQKNQKTVLEFDNDDVIITSFMFDIGEESKLVKQLFGEHIPAVGHYATLEQPMDLQWALGPVLDGPYFTYDGSYTTPSCAEVVQWAIFKTPMTISSGRPSRRPSRTPATTGRCSR